MRGGAGDYRSIGQVSGVWWSVFHFRSLAIFKIRRKKIARRQLSKTGLTFASKHTLYYSFWFHEKNVCKKSVWTYHTLESKLLLSKKSLLIVYQLSDSHSVTKGSARTMTTNTTSWDRAGTAKLAKAVRVFYRYARGWIFFTKWKYDGESTSTVLPIRIWRTVLKSAQNWRKSQN